MSKVKIAFLVYDSRSGSTLLSRELTAAFDNILVTQEIGFDTIFSGGEEALIRHGWPKVLRQLYNGNEFLNFGVSYDSALRLFRDMDRQPGVYEGIHMLLRAYAELQGRADVDWVIVKNGSHIRYWRQILQYFGGESLFLHIVRDPRAVINSKLKTVRPYHQGEVMAWGGVVPAALRWKSYVNSMYAAGTQGARVCHIRYEDLIVNVSDMMNAVSGLLQASPAGSKGTYAIPEAEQAIHKLAIEEGIVAYRSQAWLKELSRIDRLRIEFVCSKEMAKMEYAKTEDIGFLKGLALCLMEIPSIIFKFMRHACRVLKQLMPDSSNAGKKFER